MPVEKFLARLRFEQRKKLAELPVGSWRAVGMRSCNSNISPIEYSAGILLGKFITDQAATEVIRG
jgi:hypothetical protein